MQLNLSVENTLDQNHLSNTNTYSASVDKNSRANLRFSPGQIWSKLNLLFFEFNASQSETGWGELYKSGSNYLWQFFTKKHEFDFSSITNDFYAKNELRPNSKITLYSLLEWNYKKNKSNESLIQYYFNQWNEKLELKLSFNLRLILQYKQIYQDNAYNRIIKYYEPSTWLEHRWNSNFQDMINFQYTMSSDRKNNLLTDTKNLMFTYNIIWRKEKFLHLDRIEFRNDISGSLADSKGDSRSMTSKYSTTTSLDIYPFTSAIFRFQAQYQQYDDLLDSTNSTYGISYTIKVIMKF